MTVIHLCLLATGLLEWHWPWRSPDRNPIARRLRHPSLGILEGKCCTFKSYSSDGKVLLDSVAIASDGCANCDPNRETLSLWLYGQNTSERNMCQTSILDHENVPDFVAGGIKVFDGRISGQEDAAEIFLLGSCFEVEHLELYIF